jgi:hypothetical protein
MARAPVTLTASSGGEDSEAADDLTRETVSEAGIEWYGQNVEC